MLTGYVSDVTSWEDFSREWDAALRQSPSIEYFKMREAESRKEQFEGWLDDQVSKKLEVLIPIINRHAKERIECIYWQEHYDVAIAAFLVRMRQRMEPLEFKKVNDAFSDPYCLAFQMIMSNYGKILDQRESQEIVDFIFDNQTGQGPRAVKWWKGLCEVPLSTPFLKYFPNEPIHRDDKVFLPLQAADMIAWQTRRRLEDFNVKGVKEKRWEMEMLESVRLLPNRYNEQRLREFLNQLFEPLPGESAL